MCSLRFENNFLTVGHVRFRLENSCLAIERVRFASKIICVLSNVFASFWKYFAYYRRCSLRFDIEENTTIEAFVRLRFASVAITSHHYVGAWPGPPTSSAWSIRDWSVSVGNQTRDLLHCRRTLYAKSHWNGVIDWYSEPRLVLLQRNLGR
jgi:hypothetical protein